MITNSFKKYIAACRLCCGAPVGQHSRSAWRVSAGAAAVLIGLGSLTACSDILETESSRQNIEPELLSKTDSLFYGYGILQAMQQLADQYVFQGEMRGDLVTTTFYTDNNLRQLANFTATTANKYDSAYVYYRVINNCNYYLKHRKTDLYTGSTNVVINEYAAVAAIRAWAYLQLGRNYEKVPFFTEPLTQISQIDDNTFPELDLAGIVAQIAPDLEQFTGYKVPTYGLTSGHNVGSPNWESTQKSFLPSLCFIPVDVILGELYLEIGDYANAARHYTVYLTQVANTVNSPYLAPMTSKYLSTGSFGGSDSDLPDPSQIKSTVTTTAWATIFARNAVNDIITYIPMAVNQQNGCTTDVPLAFGFNYYATSEEKSDVGLREPYMSEIQIKPSDALNQLSDSTEYYFYSVGGQGNYDSIRVSAAGDMRLRSVIQQSLVSDTLMQWINKYKYANIILYRTSTVLLHLAEAFNRLGYPDAAFAILKDGISENLLTYANYITDETKNMLQTTYPLLSDENIYRFPYNEAFGIHCHGAGKAASDFATSSYLTASSPYTMSRIVGKKLREIASRYGVISGHDAQQEDSLGNITTTFVWDTILTKQDTINAVEDLLCDEYALEFAFEGCRYFDLCRLARHKNQQSPAAYPANFGYLWLSNKLKNRGWNETTMYLPFK